MMAFQTLAASLSGRREDRGFATVDSFDRSGLANRDWLNPGQHGLPQTVSRAPVSHHVISRCVLPSVDMLGVECYIRTLVR